jgi:type I restriction enzyme, S subunit
MKWEMVKLGDVCKIKGGGTPDRSNSKYWNGEIPWITVKDFTSTSISGTQEFITEEGLKNSSTNLIKKGTILMPTRMALGKVAINTIDAAINQDIKAIEITSEEKISRDYLAKFLFSKASHFESLGKGATVKGITLDVLKDLQIPLPPLATQKRIAAILDAADALRRKDQALLQKYDELAQAIFVDMFGNPVKNEKEWEVKKIKEVCLNIVDCVNRTAPILDIKTPYLMIRTSNVRNARIDLTDARCVDELTYKKWVRRLKPQKGDIVFTREAPVGEAGIIETNESVFLGQRTMLFRPNQSCITSKFLLFQLSGIAVQKQIDRLGSGSTVKHLSVPDCKEFIIHCPPIQIQRKFEGILNNLNIRNYLAAAFGDC